MKKTGILFLCAIVIALLVGITYMSINKEPLESSKETATPVSQIVNIDIPAPSIAGNMLGDPDKQPVVVYLPPSYNTSKQNYPVVYYLPGFSGVPSDLCYSIYQDFQLQKTMDKLIADGTVKEMIIVIANGKNTYLGSFYVNSPVTGNWEDFVCKDVVNYIDTNYRTIKSPEKRGISGHSMGGFGALNLAMKHPDIFGSVYALSPGLFDENGLKSTVMFNGETPVKNFLDIRKQLSAMPKEEASVELKKKIGTWVYSFDFIFTCAYGSAFSPDVDSVIPVSYPYSEKDGKLVLDADIMKKWENGFGGMTDKVSSYRENLLKLHGIRIDYGKSDGFVWIPKGCEYFAKELEKNKISYELLTYEGQHEDKLGERMEKAVLPYFSGILCKE